jgi:hypothetical protein
MKVAAVLHSSCGAISVRSKHASLEQQERCAEQAQIYSRAQHANLTNRQYADLGELVYQPLRPRLGSALCANVTAYG